MPISTMRAAATGFHGSMARYTPRVRVYTPRDATAGLRTGLWELAGALERGRKRRENAKHNACCWGMVPKSPRSRIVTTPQNPTHQNRGFPRFHQTATTKSNEHQNQHVLKGGCAEFYIHTRPVISVCLYTLEGQHARSDIILVCTAVD